MFVFKNRLKPSRRIKLDTKVATESPPINATMQSTSILSPYELLLPTRKRLVVAQLVDQSLRKCFAVVVSSDQNDVDGPSYLVDHDVLMQKCSEGSDWSVRHQIVVPACCREQVLILAHESPWAEHLGVSKTYNLILRHFFLARSKV